jgi:poly-gamma-glutamate synthesis protein (capsule biosynthesis protein)
VDKEKEMNPRMKITAVGDCFITRPLPPNDPAALDLASILQQGEARFANLEVTVHHGEASACATSGGTWAIAPPSILEALQTYGFNMIGWANNHTLDYLYDGLKSTQQYLEHERFVHAGAGDNLAQASAPRYLEGNSGRYALIGVVSTAPGWWIAGEQRSDYPGRPGVNLLRFKTIYTVKPEKMRFLRKLAQETAINATNELNIRDGFMVAPPSDEFLFGDYYFKEGEEEGIHSYPNQNDMTRILNSIGVARRKADLVIVSIHAHEMKGDKLEEPAEFLETFAHACIDHGAHIVIGHGPHILRGIEIYKQRPIFYSIGDFMYQSETVASQPADMYEKYGLGLDHNVADALDAMSMNYTRGHLTRREIFEAVIPYCEMENGELVEMTLYPIELGFGKPIHQVGWPERSSNVKILEKLRALSLPYGTDLRIQGAIARIKL